MSVLFPLLFVSGALYPTAGMPAPLRALAEVNPVTYAVDLMRHALGQQAEFTVGRDMRDTARGHDDRVRAHRAAVRPRAAAGGKG